MKCETFLWIFGALLMVWIYMSYLPYITYDVDTGETLLWRHMGGKTSTIATKLFVEQFVQASINKK